MPSTPICRPTLEPGWIDYNGHLRDGYYAVILSAAIDELMDRLGIDAAYRKRTGNTLYTLEMHLRFLREVKLGEELVVAVRILDADRKRIHAGLELLTGGRDEPAAAAEFMLLHVHQGESVGAAPFPPEVESAIADWRARSASDAPFALGSRRMGLRGG